MSKSIVIIGGGISGLCAGINCLKNGHNVQIIEKNNYYGGKCGHSKELSILDNYPKRIVCDEKMNTLFTELGINIKYNNQENFYVYKYDNASLVIKNDFDSLTSELLKNSIGDEKAIMEFLNILKIGQKHYINYQKPKDFLNILEYSKYKKAYSANEKIVKKYQKISIKEYFKRFNSAIIKNAFCSLLPANTSMSGLIFYLGRILNGEIKVVESNIIDQLYQKYNCLGGKYLFNKNAKKLLLNKYNRIESVVLSDGNIVHGDYFISCIDPLATYNNLLEKKYKDRKLFLKLDNPLDYYLNRKIIIGFKINTVLPMNDFVIQTEEFGFNTQRFNYLYFKTNQQFLYCEFYQNQNDYDYLNILLKKEKNIKKIIGDMISKIETEIKKAFPNIKLSYMDTIIPQDVAQEFNCYQGYTNGFYSTPQGYDIQLDYNIEPIKNLLIGSSLITSNGGITNSFITGKFSAMKLQRIINNEKETGL